MLPRSIYVYLVVVEIETVLVKKLPKQLIASTDRPSHCFEVHKRREDLIHALLVLQLLQPAEMHQQLFHISLDILGKEGGSSPLHIHDNGIVFLRIDLLTLQLAVFDVLFGLWQNFLGQCGRTSKKMAICYNGKSLGNASV